MTTLEFEAIANRLSVLWPPSMSAAAVNEYWLVLKDFEPGRVHQAVTMIARQPREFRPDVGTIYETALGSEVEDRLELPGAVTNLLTPEQHRTAMVEIGRSMTPEHQRRHQAVMDLLRRTGVQLPLAVLWQLMPERSCTAERFDSRLAAIEEKLQQGAKL